MYLKMSFVSEPWWGLGVFFDRDFCIIHTVAGYTHFQKSLLDKAEQMFSLLQIPSHSLTKCLGTPSIHARAAFRGQTLLPSWLLSYCNSVISSTFSSSGEQRWREAGWRAAVISQHFYANPVITSTDYAKCACKNSPSQSNHTGSCQGHNCG